MLVGQHKLFRLYGTSLVHSNNPDSSTSLNEEELKASILIHPHPSASIRIHLRRRRQDLSPTEKSLHLNISANLNRATSITLTRWLHLLAEERERTIRMKRTQQIRRGGGLSDYWLFSEGCLLNKGKYLISTLASLFYSHENIASNPNITVSVFVSVELASVDNNFLEGLFLHFFWKLLLLVVLLYLPI